MNYGLDTNVVLRLVLGEPEGQAAAASRLLAEEGSARVALSDVVVAEAYFALRHHYHVPHKETIAALRALASDKRVACTGAARHVLSQHTTEADADEFMDRMIQAGYERDGVRLATFDKSAARMRGALRLGAS